MQMFELNLSAIRPFLHFAIGGLITHCHLVLTWNMMERNESLIVTWKLLLYVRFIYHVYCVNKLDLNSRYMWYIFVYILIMVEFTPILRGHFFDIGKIIPRADSRFAPSQWETALPCNGVSHWLGASLESALIPPAKRPWIVGINKS